MEIYPGKISSNPNGRDGKSNFFENKKATPFKKKLLKGFKLVVGLSTKKKHRAKKVHRSKSASKQWFQ